MRKTIYTITIILFVTMTIAAQGAKESSIEKPIVAVSIIPQAYFVDTLAHDLVQTLTLVGEGQSPHSYEITPSQMAQLSKAQAWILSGTDFESALKDKISSLYPNLAIADGTKGMAFRMLEEHDHQDEEEEHHDEHDMNLDRHTWLGWQQSTVLLSNTKEVLVALLPMQKSLIEERATKLQARIDDLFTKLKAELVGIEGKIVYVYHPAFGYFLDSFGLEQKAVETGGKEPTAKDLASLIAQARSEQARVLFVQKQFPAQSAITIAQAVGAKVLSLDPLAYDFLENIRVMGAALLELKENHD